MNSSYFRRLRVGLIASGLLLGMLATTTGCGSSADDDSKDSNSSKASKDTIVFAAIPSENSQSLKNSFQNVIKLLEKETGKKVEFQNATNYAAVIEGQRAGKIDIAAYGPFSYVIARDSKVPTEALASTIDAPGETPSYKSYAYVPTGSTIKTLKDAKGKKVCFVDKASTSGYLVPSKGLIDAGLDPNKDIQEVMSGAHDATLLAVASKQCDIGFAHDAMETTLIKQGGLKEGQISKIWESDSIPGGPIAINTTSLDKETQKKIAKALQEKANKPALVKAGICSSEEDCELPEETKYGYTKVSDSDYDAVRQVCEVTKAKACQN